MSPHFPLTKRSPSAGLYFRLSFLSGLLLIACQPPLSLFFAAYAALIPLFFALEPGKGRRNFLAGFIAGAVSYLGLIYWVVVAMDTYGGIGIPFAVLTLVLFVLYLSLFTGCFAWLVSILEEPFNVPLVLSAPPAWALLEYLRGVLLSGFPWSFLAHSQHNVLPLVQIVSVTGTYFLSFLLVTANCLIYRILTTRRIPLVYGSVVVCVFAACLLFGYYRLAEPVGGTNGAAIVQGNIRQDIKFDEAFKQRTIDTYRTLTALWSHPSDLVIWPETAMPFVFLQDTASVSVRALPVALSNCLLLGTISRDDRGRYYNTAYVVGKGAEIAGTYLKRHLVPFGEYVPLNDYFPFLERISVAVGNFFPGPSHDPLVTQAGKIGILICYEGGFPSITNDTVRRGAEVLVNITNDAWFGKSSAPYQHFAFYVFRAVETDRFVLRAANTGISAIIDPRGRTKARMDIFTQGVLSGTFGLRHGITPYVRYGDYFVLLAFLFLAIMVIAQGVGARSRAVAAGKDTGPGKTEKPACPA
jgi:apolipoprotein N-acyltransferase